MLNNMTFYNFMHRQILVLIFLFLLTGPGFIYSGYIKNSYYFELTWFIFLVAISFWGYRLHDYYAKNHLTIVEKENWLKQLSIFLYIFFSMWTIMFIKYTSSDTIELHYIVIATQLGSGVVASTILASQKKLAVLSVVSIMSPLVIYFILVDEYFSYLLAFFTLVLSAVLLYAAHNTFNYLLKSQFQAYHDYLTGLGNRRYFVEQLEDTVNLHKKNPNYNFLLLIDLDHFKTINDTLGHDVGDILLCEVAKRMEMLSSQCKSSVSRLGGDEFCILSQEFNTYDECLNKGKEFALTLLNHIKKSYIIDNQHLYISASIGLSIVHKLENAQNFIKEADIAMYEAKTKGRDGIILFNDELSQRVQRKLDIERFLHFTLDKNEIYLSFQPQIFTQNSKIACEVLIRWNNSELGLVPPDEFIPIAEQTGFIIELGYYVIEQTLITLQEWDNKGIAPEQVAINISVRQIFHSNFVNDVTQLCQKYLTDNLCSKLIFEITETSVAEDLSVLIETMNALKKLGIRFSMDDFGTGYSSLNYLSRIPIDELKIDKSFIMSINSTSDKSVVNTILDIANSMNLTTVAEGVETPYQLKYLTQHGCDILQGYHFAKPLVKEEFEDFMHLKSPQ